MVRQSYPTSHGVLPAADVARLEVIVPYTTQELTQAALQTAEQMASGLHAHVRILCVVPVPIQLPLDRPPVSLSHLRSEIEALKHSALTSAEIHLTHDANYALAHLIRKPSIVVIATKRRAWPTRQLRLARLLTRLGAEVFLNYIKG